MKNLIFTFLSALLLTNAVAQITITNDDIAPAGTVVLLSTDSLTMVNPGPAGSDLVWDFSTLTAHETDTVSLLLPAQTPYGANFPLANFAVGLESDGQFAYFNRNSSLLSNIGVAGDGGEYGFVITSLVPGNIYLDFPVNFGNTRTESYYINVKLADNSLPGVDSVRYKSTTDEITTIDAWGTMKLPVGTFNVLRQKEEKTITDSIWTRFFGNWLLLSSGVSEVDTYNWWTDDLGAGFTLCTVDVEQPSQDVSEVTFLNSYTVGLQDSPTSVLSVYPNPASDRIRIDYPGASDVSRLVIRNISGGLVDMPYESGRATIEFNVVGIPAGLYFATMTLTSGEVLTAKFMVSR